MRMMPLLRSFTAVFLCAALIGNAPLQALAADSPKVPDNFGKWEHFRVHDDWKEIFTEWSYKDFISPTLHDGETLYVIDSKTDAEYKVKASPFTLQIEQGRVWNTYYAKPASGSRIKLYRNSIPWFRGKQKVTVVSEAPEHHDEHATQPEHHDEHATQPEHHDEHATQPEHHDDGQSRYTDEYLKSACAGVLAEKPDGAGVHSPADLQAACRKLCEGIRARGTTTGGNVTASTVRQHVENIAAGEQTFTGTEAETQDMVLVPSSSLVGIPQELRAACRIREATDVKPPGENTLRTGEVPNITNAGELTPDKETGKDPAKDAKDKRLLKRDMIGGAIGAVGFGILGFIFGGPFGFLLGAVGGGALMAGVTHLNNKGIE